ncbi:MAG: metalloregulator ArsR/SmtB family transcription factor [Candidatus Cloacimonetes bacterium]|nr:metalloregulator ArsR/SmtB family transcription factor [Candidatus Cloacimonadota bacterium]
MKMLLTVFKALADSNRLRIIAALTQYDELCATQIIELLQVKGASASRQLGILMSAGLVESRRDGRWVYYSFQAPQSDYKSFIEWMKAEFEKSALVQQDIKLLEGITKYAPEELCRRQRGIKCCPV